MVKFDFYLKMFIFFQVFYKFNGVLVNSNIIQIFFFKLDKLIFNFIQENKNSQIFWIGR